MATNEVVATNQQNWTSALRSGKYLQGKEIPGHYGPFLQKFSKTLPPAQLPPHSPYPDARGAAMSANDATIQHLLTTHELRRIEQVFHVSPRDTLEHYQARTRYAAHYAARRELTGADLRWVHLCGKDLEMADLTGTNLEGADLTKANLREADLTSANLANANLEDADLTGAILTGATMPQYDWLRRVFR